MAFNYYINPILFSEVNAASGSGSAAAVSEINKLLNMLYTCIGYAGTLIALYAVGMIILSFKSEQYEAISKHVMQACVAIVLISLKKFLS